MFGQKLKELRKKNSLTQENIAVILECDQSMVSLWENGKCEPTENVIKRAAIFFKTSSDYLIGLEDEDGTKLVQRSPEARNEALVNNNFQHVAGNVNVNVKK